MVFLMTHIDLAAAEAVKVAIWNAGQTPSAVAKEVGITPTTWHRRMNGEVGFRVHELVRIAEALGIEPGKLVDSARDLTAKSPDQLRRAS